MKELIRGKEPTPIERLPYAEGALQWPRGLPRAKVIPREVTPDVAKPLSAKEMAIPFCGKSLLIQEPIRDGAPIVFHNSTIAHAPSRCRAGGNFPPSFWSEPFLPITPSIAMSRFSGIGHPSMPFHGVFACLLEDHHQ